MKKTISLFTIFLCFFLPESNAQYSRYLIKLKFKQGTNSLDNPSQFLTQRSIDRRNRYNIPLDSSDLPVPAAYIDSIRLSGTVTIISSSKWLNEVCIQTFDASALNKINTFPFVIATSPIAARPSKNSMPEKNSIEENIRSSQQKPSSPLNTTDYYNYGQAYNQIHMHKGEFLHNYGFRGEGMWLAFTDAGFTNYLTLPTFDSVRNNNQILGTWDFVSNNTNVNEDHAHGTNCFSTIAANMPGVFVGTAPKTNFFLFRTEDTGSEFPVEEHNFAVAAERADSLGIDVISCSLGYNHFTNSFFDYTYSDLDGNTAIMSQAVDIAAKKGILVVTAAGNDGSSEWEHILVPADADSTLTVGAVNYFNQPVAFSSTGPTSDGQIKPDVVAIGENAIVANVTTGQPAFNNGTSFACPIIAGLTTCLWQAFPEVNNMTIIDVIRESSDRYITPDNKTGYGVPDMMKAFVSLIQKLETQEFSLKDCKAELSWSAKCSAEMNFVIERKLPNETEYSPIYTQSVLGNFSTKSFSYADDLANQPTPSVISYRIKMMIGPDTSFYFEPSAINYLHHCNTYTFTGDGNWDIPANWENNTIPPATLTSGSSIIINPVNNGECILNVSQTISPGAHFIVEEGKKLLVPGNLIVN